MKNYPKYIKNTLHFLIQDMAKHPEDFCCNPKTDFTRKRKLPFEKVLTLLVKMGGHSLRDEMLDCLDFKDMPASVSALVQQRSKILRTATKLTSLQTPSILITNSLRPPELSAQMNTNFIVK